MGYLHCLSHKGMLWDVKVAKWKLWQERQGNPFLKSVRCQEIDYQQVVVCSRQHTMEEYQTSSPAFEAERLP